MSREAHVRNCEGVGVKLPRATRPSMVRKFVGIIFVKIDKGYLYHYYLKKLGVQPWSSGLSLAARKKLDRKGGSSTWKEKKTDKRLKKMLREAGYNISKGMEVTLSLRLMGGECSGGCRGGCYTCAPGNSNHAALKLSPTFQFDSAGVVQDLVTISESTE